MAVIDHRRQVRTAETHLLYENADTGTVVSIVIASLLAYALRDSIPRVVGVAWLSYMLLISVARSVLAHRYRQASPSDKEAARWNQAFVVGAAMAAIGWGAGAFVLNPASQPTNEILLVFAVGGVMLGGASLLAARPEAFLTFLLPAGFLTALRLAIEGDPDHMMMAFLAALFTVATVVTTWRFHLAIRILLPAPIRQPGSHRESSERQERGGRPQSTAGAQGPRPYSQVDRGGSTQG